MTTETVTDDRNLRIAYSHLLSIKHFLCWRIFVTIYFIAVLLTICIVYGYVIIYYFTNWTVIIGLIYAATACYATYLYYKQEMDRCNRGCSIASFFQMLAASTSIVVVLVFWFITAPLGGYSMVYLLSDGIQIQVHGITMILTIFDFYICCNTISFKQTWWKLFLYGLGFAFWSIIFIAVAKYPLYPVVLDWINHFQISLICSIFIMAITVGFHAILCWTNNKLINRRAPEKENENSMNAR